MFVEKAITFDNIIIIFIINLNLKKNEKCSSGKNWSFDTAKINILMFKYFRYL